MTKRLLAAALAVSVTGCSAILMERVPANYDPFTSDVHCTGTKGFVAWDGFLAVLWLATAVGGGYLAKTTEKETEGLATVGVSGAFMIGHIASASVGDVWVNECRKQREARTQIENAAAGKK